MSGARQISFEDAPFSAIHKKITAGTFMGQISDGYTLGIVGISLNYAMEPLGLTSFWMGLIGAGSMFGIFFGSLLAGITADKIGRRPLYASLMLLTAIVSVLQFFLSDPLLIAIVRFVLGMLIGADYTVGIPLLSEWAPAKKRAGILGWLLVFWTIGYCISYIVGFFMDGFVAAFGNDGCCAQPDRPRHPLRHARIPPVAHRQGAPSGSSRQHPCLSRQPVWTA